MKWIENMINRQKCTHKLAQKHNHNEIYTPMLPRKKTTTTNNCYFLFRRNNTFTSIFIRLHCSLSLSYDIHCIYHHIEKLQRHNSNSNSNNNFLNWGKFSIFSTIVIRISNAWFGVYDFETAHAPFHHIQICISSHCEQLLNTIQPEWIEKGNVKERISCTNRTGKEENRYIVVLIRLPNIQIHICISKSLFSYNIDVVNILYELIPRNAHRLLNRHQLKNTKMPERATIDVIIVYIGLNFNLKRNYRHWVSQPFLN